MTAIGTEGCPLWTGAQLRDAALAQSKQGREQRIQEVRERLMRTVMGWTITADDVMDACEALGFMEKDMRWTGNVLRGWGQVEATDHYTPSQRPQRHARPLRVWRWR